MKIHKERLYDLLKAAERESREIRDLRNLEETQKKIIERYKKNPLIQDTLFKDTPILQNARWLESEKYKHWRVFIPHKKDYDYNARVNCLAELVENKEGTIKDMKTKGVFYPDNFVNLSSYVAAGSFVLFKLATVTLSHLVNNHQDTQIIEQYFGTYVPIMISVGFGPCLGLWASSRKRLNLETVEKIKYIDTIIRSIYLEQ